MIRLNHKTLKFRLIDQGLTVARVDEIEMGITPGGLVTRGYSYKEDGRRVLEAQIPMTYAGVPAIHKIHVGAKN